MSCKLNLYRKCLGSWQDNEQIWISTRILYVIYDFKLAVTSMRILLDALSELECELNPDESTHTHKGNLMIRMRSDHIHVTDQNFQLFFVRLANSDCLCHIWNQHWKNIQMSLNIPCMNSGEVLVVCSDYSTKIFQTCNFCTLRPKKGNCCVVLK